MVHGEQRERLHYRQRWMVVIAMLVIGGLSLALAGCGGSSLPSPDSGGGTPTPMSGY